MRSQVGFPKNFVENFVANFVEGWPPLLLGFDKVCDKVCDKGVLQNGSSTCGSFSHPRGGFTEFRIYFEEQGKRPLNQNTRGCGEQNKQCEVVHGCSWRKESGEEFAG
jgi:hypothetical protein